jgi:hypothetical protein
MNIKEFLQSKKDFFQSKKFKTTLVVIGLAAVILAVFQIGMFVGFKKASFSNNWGNNYYRAFGEPQARGGLEKMGFPQGGMGFTESHGVSGRVLRVAPHRLMIEGMDKVEKSVLIKDGTVIRRFRDDIDISKVQMDEIAVVLGSPNDNGEIEASFVRLMPPPPFK